MAHSRRKQNKSVLDELLDAPWQVSILLGMSVLLGLEWILPSLAEGNVLWESIVHGISAVAWVLYGLFFLIGMVVYAKAASSRSNQPAPAGVKGGTGEGSVSSQRTPAASTTGRQVHMAPKTAEFPSVALNPADQTAAQGDSPDIDGAGEQPSSEMAAKPTEWSIDVIGDIEWKRFEDVCQKFYEMSGIRSETTALGPDRAIDIVLYQDGTGKPTAIVQCKAWGKRPVGVKPVRELLGVMTHEKIGKALL